MNVHLIAAGKFHDIDFARLELLKLLAEHAEIRTSVSADYADTASLATADLLITYTCDLVPTDAQTAALRDFLERGGRWLALHGTNAILRFASDGKVDCPDEVPDFMALAGSRFAAHPPIEPFKVFVTRDDHPMTAGLRDFRHRGRTVSQPPHRRYRRAAPHQLHRPLRGVPRRRLGRARGAGAVRHAVGAGRVLYLTLGHCRGHYDLRPVAPFWPHPQRCAWNYPIFYELLRRAIRWGRPQID